MNTNSSNQDARPSLDSLVNMVIASYEADPRTQHIDSRFLPTREKAIDLLYGLQELIFPGFFGRQHITSDNVKYHVGDLLQVIREDMDDQIETALRYTENLETNGRGDACDECTQRAQSLTDTFLGRIPHLRTMLALDVQAAYDGDPATRNTDEAIFTYPGVEAIFIHRIAHELFKLNVPLIPRMMSEYGHSKSGIDIHPGATIGQSFFIDHGTGVVVGETTEIGDRVKLYQGVTLGALSFPKDERGDLVRGHKRHPTIHDDVVIYANATVLGGNTIIGKGSVIGGGVFLTKSVPAGHMVSFKAPEYKWLELGNRV